MADLQRTVLEGHLYRMVPRVTPRPLVHAFSQGRWALALCGASNADDGDAPASEDWAEVTCGDCNARRRAMEE